MGQQTEWHNSPGLEDDVLEGGFYVWSNYLYFGGIIYNIF